MKENCQTPLHEWLTIIQSPSYTSASKCTKTLMAKKRQVYKTDKEVCLKQNESQRLEIRISLVTHWKCLEIEKRECTLKKIDREVCVNLEICNAH